MFGAAQPLERRFLPLISGIDGRGRWDPLSQLPLHPCWVPLPAAGQGEAAGSLAEFSPGVSMASTPGGRGGSPSCFSSSSDLCGAPILREPGLLLLSAPREHPFPSLPFPSLPLLPGPGITCRAERGSHAGNELLGWDLLAGAAWGTPNSGRERQQLLKTTLIPAAAGNEREPRPGGVQGVSRGCPGSLLTRAERLMLPRASPRPLRADPLLAGTKHSPEREGKAGKRDGRRQPKPGRAFLRSSWGEAARCG